VGAVDAHGRKCRRWSSGVLSAPDATARWRWL
jgi:hypothetical protein